MAVFSTLLATLAACATLSTADTVYVQSDEYHAGDYGVGPTQSFYSSSFTPVAFNLDVPVNSSNVDPGYIFIAPRGTAVTSPMTSIFDNNGSLIWAGLEYGQGMGFQIVSYKAEDHILLWSGAFQAAGYGNGRNLVLDRTYAVVANFTIGHDNIPETVLADFHDAQITTNNTALMTAYSPLARNLTAYGGPEDGYLFEGIAQELDIATNTILFEWHSLDHIDPSLCYADPGSTGSESNAWDYFHINSIDKDSKGNFLISSRHCHAGFYVSGATGEVLWQIGGKNSSFTQGNGTDFYWQHDIRWHANETQLSIFDNAASTWEVNNDTARGMILDIDLNQMSVNLAQELLPWNRTASPSQGNVQFNETSGHAMVGYGYVPQLSEYDADGKITFAATFGVAGGGVQTYRALRYVWHAYPTTLPSIAVLPNSTDSVFVSWNGATEVQSWALFGANDTSSPTFLSNTTKTGFETTLPVSDGSYQFYQVAGIDSNGAYLGFSNFTSSDGSSEAPSAAQSSEVAAIPSATSTGSSTPTASSTSVTAAGSSSGAGQTSDMGAGVILAALVVGAFAF